MTIPASPVEAFQTYQRNWMVHGAEHINETPVTLVLNENLNVPKDMCEGKLMVQVDFEERSGMVHVRLFSTKTGEPVAEGMTFHLPPAMRAIIWDN